MRSCLEEASRDEAGIICSLLLAMQAEIKELPLDKDQLTTSVTESLETKQVQWFIFRDENGHPFGTCYLQTVYNYWQPEKRMYLGGLTILSTHRRQGRLKAIYAQIKTWAKDHNAYEVYAHINRHNEQSVRAFSSIGFKEMEYRLYTDAWKAKTC